MKRHFYASLLASLAIALFQSGAQADLIGHYKFDGNTDDSSGNGNNGTAEGDAAASANGIVGGAYEFSGAGHVVVPIDVNPAQIPDMTVTMWVKPADNIPSAPGLYKTFGHDDGGWDRTFGLDNRQEDGDFRYAAFTGGARPGPTPNTGTEITSDWTFVAAVWDTDGAGVGSHTVRFHAGENSVVEGLTNTPSSHVTAAIGNLRPDNFAEGFQGLIDEVQIYDSALSVAEVDAIRESVPEPGSVTLMLLGCLGVSAWIRRRK